MDHYIVTDEHFIKVESIQCIWPSGSGFWRVFLDGGNYFDVNPSVAREIIEKTTQIVRKDNA